MNRRSSPPAIVNISVCVELPSPLLLKPSVNVAPAPVPVGFSYTYVVVSRLARFVFNGVAKPLGRLYSVSNLAQIAGVKFEIIASGRLPCLTELALSVWRGSYVRYAT